MSERKATYQARPPSRQPATHGAGPGRAVSFTVEGNPIPKERPRVILRPGRRATAYTPQRTRAWEGYVGDVARLAMAGRPPLTGPVELTLRIWRATAARADGDNILKGVSDALNGIVWEDDSQIVTCHWYKAIDRDRPRVEVLVEGLGEEHGLHVTA